MPRVIQLPLSGGDRKAQAKELRRARGLYDEYMKQSAQVRAEAHAKYREADRLECNAWNAIMFCGGCVYRKLKLGRSGDEVRPEWRVN
jgi:hypothetical protein